MWVSVGVMARWVMRTTLGSVSSCRCARQSSGVGRSVTMDWIMEAQSLGAGEIVLNCIDRDGVRRGYDIEQLAAARTRLTIPLVASGGAGSAADFTEVFQKADVSGALAASVFHTGAIAIPDLKMSLAAAGIEVRT